MTSMANFAPIIGMLLSCILTWLFCNWHIRFTFVAVGLNLKGSWKRKNRRYKEKWTFIQRIALLPLLQCSKSRVYTGLFFLNLSHFIVSVLTMIWLILNECVGVEIFLPWHYFYYAMGGLTVLEIVITLSVARSK